MLQQENQTQSQNFQGFCQAISALGDPCDMRANFHCGIEGNASAQCTLRRKRGIAARLNPVRRVARGDFAHFSDQL